MKEIFKKLEEARSYIKTNAVSKEGKNSFAKYNYFTPEQVSLMVARACYKAKLSYVYELLVDELGYYGHITLIDTENGENLTCVVRTQKPTSKGMNETQMMGSLLTYSRRYSLCNLFDINEGTPDFDSDQYVIKSKSSPKQIKTPPTYAPKK